MPTLVIVRRPRTARSVTQTVRMRFLVGTRVANGRLRHMLIGYARASKAGGVFTLRVPL